MGSDAVFAHSIVQVTKIGKVDPKKIYRKCLRFGRIYKRADCVANTTDQNQSCFIPLMAQPPPGKKRKLSGLNGLELQLAFNAVL